jgi:hypothetical protein
MTTFIRTTVEVDIDDIISDLSPSELQELVDDLYDEGYSAKKSKISEMDEDWNDQINKLLNNKWRLSLSDEELILQITNKIL